MQFDELGWLDEAIEVDCLQKSMPRLGYKPTHIVIHGTAGGSSAEGVAHYFATSDVEASTHFVIGQDGHIVQCIPCSLAAWGNGVLDQPKLPFPPTVNPNYYTISIEHVKPSLDNSDSLTDAQQVASFRLIDALCNNYNIPRRSADAIGGICSHADLDSVNRARCPGQYPWEALWSSLARPVGGNEVHMGIPDRWAYDIEKKVLTAPNDIQVTDGFCQWILSHGWDATNLPLMPAFGLSPVELGNTGLGNGTVQPFRTKILAWTPKNGVYEMWVGQEYIALYKHLSASGAQLKKAQDQLADAQSTVQKLQAEIAESEKKVAQANTTAQQQTTTAATLGATAVQALEKATSAVGIIQTLLDSLSALDTLAQQRGQATHAAADIVTELQLLHATLPSTQAHGGETQPSEGDSTK